MLNLLLSFLVSSAKIFSACTRCNQQAGGSRRELIRQVTSSLCLMSQGMSSFRDWRIPWEHQDPPQAICIPRYIPQDVKNLVDVNGEEIIPKNYINLLPLVQNIPQGPRTSKEDIFAMVVLFPLLLPFTPESSPPPPPFHQRAWGHGYFCWKGVWLLNFVNYYNARLIQ